MVLCPIFVRDVFEHASCITLSVASIGSPHAAHDILCRSMPIMALNWFELMIRIKQSVYFL